MAGPHQVLQDYKPEELEGERPVRRAPWFAAGLGIPLLSVSFMSPQSSPPAEDPVQAAARSIDELLQTRPAETAVATEPVDPVEVSAEELLEEILPGTEVVFEVRRGDSLDRLFKRHDLSRADLANLMRLELARKHLRLVRPGDQIEVRHADGRVLSLRRELEVDSGLSIRRIGDEFEAEVISLDLEARPVRTSGRISSSLFEAAMAAGISDRTIMNLAGIFAWDIDFVLDIRQGDDFTLVYQELWRDGELLGEGDILAAEFVNQGRRFQAIRYADPSGRVDYYTPEGRSVRKAFVRAPLSFSRVSSNFNPRRRHPKLNTIRAHRGVDYAAPTGTPIKAAGDGKVVFRGRKGGYGNTIILQHGGNISTLYAHLSRFSRVRNGAHVKQGDVIGFVGATGLATGPHLHYEYRRNGVHLNPRTVKLPDAAPIDPRLLAEFQKTAEPLLQQIEEQRRLFAAESSKTTT